MNEYLFDLEDYFYHDDSISNYETFSKGGYPSQDEFAENPDVIYFDEVEYSF